MALDYTRVMTFGDVRRGIIADIQSIRDGTLSPQKGHVMAMFYKELNANIQVEINAAKMALLTESKAHSFGRLVGMGKTLIGSEGGADE